MSAAGEQRSPCRRASESRAGRFVVAGWRKERQAAERARGLRSTVCECSVLCAVCSGCRVGLTGVAARLTPLGSQPPPPKVYVPVYLTFPCTAHHTAAYGCKIDTSPCPTSASTSCADGPLGHRPAARLSTRGRCEVGTAQMYHVHSHLLSIGISDLQPIPTRSNGIFRDADKYSLCYIRVLASQPAGGACACRASSEMRYSAGQQ